MSKDEKTMVFKAEWQAFRDAGLLWFVNRILHVFGWVLVIQLEDDGTISDAWPARSKFRGFDIKSEEENFEKVARFLRDNGAELYDEAEYDEPVPAESDKP